MSKFYVVILDDLTYRHTWIHSIDYTEAAQGKEIIFLDYYFSDELLTDLWDFKLPARIDVLFLDHDLEGSFYDGRGVARELAKWRYINKAPIIDLIVLQSDYDAGRNVMEKTLVRAKVAKYVNNLHDGESNSGDSLICWLEDNRIKSKPNPEMKQYKYRDWSSDFVADVDSNLSTYWKEYLEKGNI